MQDEEHQPWEWENENEGLLNAKRDRCVPRDPSLQREGSRGLGGPQVT